MQTAAPAVNITTVYRTLDLLERIGMVRHTHLGHGAPTYSEQEHQHVHLVCHRCGAVTEIPTELMAELADRLLRRRPGSGSTSPTWRCPGSAATAGPTAAAREPVTSDAGLPGFTGPNWTVRRTTATRWPSSGRWRARPRWSTGPTAR